MALKVIEGEVFDPALSGVYELPARLEVVIAGVPEIPTYSETTPNFEIAHYHWLKKIESVGITNWNYEAPEVNAVIFNSHPSTVAMPPMIPITVSHAEETSAVVEDYYVSVPRARRIIRKINEQSGYTGYEILPDPTWAESKDHGWYIQHSNRACVMCAQDLAAAAHAAASELDFRRLPDVCILYPIRSHRLIALCKMHTKEVNAEWEAERTRRR